MWSLLPCLHVSCVLMDLFYLPWNIPGAGGFTEVLLQLTYA